MSQEHVMKEHKEEVNVTELFTSNDVMDKI